MDPRFNRTYLTYLVVGNQLRFGIRRENKFLYLGSLDLGTEDIVAPIEGMMSGFYDMSDEYRRINDLENHFDRLETISTDNMGNA